VNLLARLGRVEARTACSDRQIEIVATDEADAAAQFEHVLLAIGPGSVSLAVTIAGQTFERKTWNILPQEEWLEQASS